MLEFFTRRQPDINYDFILNVYLVAVALCFALFVSDKFLHIDDIQGFWVVLSPFIPCLIWVLLMKRQPELSGPKDMLKKND
jgi:hypothetical protein